MSLEQQLHQRSNSTCELCGATNNLAVYPVPPEADQSLSTNILACETCTSQINKEASIDMKHWRCLNESMWNDAAPVQVVSWRMLSQLKSEDWAQDLLDMMYLDDETMEWAKALEAAEAGKVVHVDANGTILKAGDTVVIIKDLNVKGSSMVAKRGTSVRKISLVFDNPEQIEGRVNDQQIVILTQYVRKTK